MNRRFGLDCSEVYQDSVGDFYVAKCNDRVYLVTADLCHAKLLAEEMDGAAKVMEQDTLEDAIGGWRYYGEPYDRFAEEERPGEEIDGDFVVCT